MCLLQAWIIFFALLCLGTCHDDETKPSKAELILHCEGKSLAVLHPQPLPPKVNFTDCPPPSDSYAALFQSYKTNAATITELDLERPTNLSQLLPSHFEGLALRSLSIHNDDERDLVKLDDHLFDPLIGTLREVSLWRVKLPPLPESIKLDKLSVMRGSSLGHMGGCSELKSLEVMHWVAQDIPGGFAGHCPKLTEMDLFHVMEQTVRCTLTGAKKVTYLKIRKCALLYLTKELFEDLVELRKFIFIEHSIYGMDPRAFESQTKLVELDMSSNEMFATRELMAAVSPLRALRSLSLANNPLPDFCNVWTVPMQLERLSLRKLGLTHLCFSEWNSLRYLDLSENNIYELDFKHLPSKHTQPLEVDLRKNPITVLPTSEMDYLALLNRINQSNSQNLTILVDLTLDCDCKHAWFVRALQSIPQLIVKGVQCSHGKHFEVARPEFLERLECDKSLCSDCVCRRSWRDNGTVADCHGAKLQNVAEIEVPNLQSLFAAGNLIDSLPAQFPETLEYMDLRDNRLAHVSSDSALSLFASQHRRMRLAGNPLVCDCDNAHFIFALHEHRSQVEDFDSLTCVNDGRALAAVIADDLCDELIHLWPVIALLAVVAVILTIAGALYWRYSRQIKIFLYARGCCLSCLQEDEINGKCEFDAFISFSHEDDEFVNDHLLPGLNDYRLCIHYRHWIAGDWIPAQIARSIERSKRTIIVLSKNFLDSPWGMLEFRMAHAAMLQEGRIRLIAVILDDVIHDEALDAELRGYLASNTYIKWGDPWFFDKLRYALPHQKTDETEEKGANDDLCREPTTITTSWNSLHPA